MIVTLTGKVQFKYAGDLEEFYKKNRQLDPDLIVSAFFKLPYRYHRLWNFYKLLPKESKKTYKERFKKALLKSPRNGDIYDWCCKYKEDAPFLFKQFKKSMRESGSILADDWDKRFPGNQRELLSICLDDCDFLSISKFVVLDKNKEWLDTQLTTKLKKLFKLKKAVYRIADFARFIKKHQDKCLAYIIKKAPNDWKDIWDQEWVTPKYKEKCDLLVTMAGL